MYMPSLFRTRGFDDFMDFSFPEFSKDTYTKRIPQMMKTDVRELEDGYEVDIELPGFGKDEISIELEKGNLTVSAARSEERETADKKSSYIRRERYSGNMSRSFYVGENMTEKDIHARFENGVLTLSVPKTPQAAVETVRKVAID